jgi:hypothetical protein
MKVERRLRHSLNEGRLQLKSRRSRPPPGVLKKRLLKPRDRRKLKGRTFEPLTQGELKIFTNAIVRQPVCIIRACGWKGG